MSEADDNAAAEMSKASSKPAHSRRTLAIQRLLSTISF
jgi:hypothetical protein